MFRKVIILVLAAFSCFSLIAGAGIPISSCNDLQDMRLDLSADYYLTQDIDCRDFAFTPIPGRFIGTLTGLAEENAPYTIRHLTITAAPKHHGALFESLSAGTVSDLRFEHAVVRSDDDTFRGLIAARMSSTVIENVQVYDLDVGGPVTDFSLYTLSGLSGGLVGYAETSDFVNVHLSKVKVKQHTWAGGMIGQARFVNVIHSSVTDLSSPWEWQRIEPYPDLMIYGGLIGLSGDGIHISTSFASGTIFSSFHSGGLIGWAEGSTLIENSYAQVNVSAMGYAGGLIGRNMVDVTLRYVYAAAPVAGEYARGMIGSASRHGDVHTDVTQSYFDKDVTNKKYSGDEGSQARSTQRMTREHNETFASTKGWSRDIWIFKKGEYPQLK